MARSNSNADKLIRQKAELERELNKFTRIMGVEAKNFFVQSFRNQGFTDRRLERWQRRRNNSDPGRAILVKSGNLRRSIRVLASSINEVTIGSDLPYAQIHNEGGRMRRGMMPRRQFIGESYQLNRRLMRILDRTIKKVFRQ